jgi:hypothetical protein
LQEAEQLDLRGEGDLAHLVEEDGAAVRLLEAALPAGDGAGERALLVAEQLALQQRLGERRAVEAHERGLRPGARVVDHLGDELLAGAGLAHDEDARLRRRDLLDEAHEVRTMDGCVAITWPNAFRSRSFWRRREFSCRRRARSTERSTTAASTWKSSGFVR